jgi:hypothetical protein
MPKIEQWTKFPDALKHHLIDRMRDRSLSLADLNKLRVWIDSNPEVPEDDWYKDFGSFKLCGKGKYPKTFLMANQFLRYCCFVLLPRPKRERHSPL